MEQIQYSGLHDVEEGDRRILDKLSAEYYDKIARELKNETALQVHIKSYKKIGKPKFSIHVKAIAPTRIFVSTKAHDFDFATCLHMAFRDLETQIHHRLHTDDQKPKNIFKRGEKPLTPEFARRIGLHVKNFFRR
ncbi:MAG: hypothetical protein Q7R76_04155 [Candidatus Woesearchaeota archaeon]|nr:hypothetical protein [Candidatus Woesearchaeota archaeon]